MKRTLSAILALILTLALSAAASAEAYTHPEAGYGFAVPEGWIVLNSATVDTLLDFGAQAIESEVDLSAMLEQVKSLPMTVLFKTLDSTNNINVLPQDLGMPATVSDLLPLAGMFEAQYQAVFADYVTSIPLTEAMIGDWEVAIMGGEYTLMGMDLSLRQVLLMSGTIMYTFSLTVESDEMEEFELVLMELVASFVAP